MSSAETRLLATLLGSVYPAACAVHTERELYALAVATVFCTAQTGPVIEALRRAYTAILKGTPARGTPEFDALCAWVPSTTTGENR